MNLLFFFPAPIILALLLNEVKNKLLKRSIQTMIYIPHFISMVIVASITFTLLNAENGVITQLSTMITGENPEFYPIPSTSAGLLYCRYMEGNRLGHDHFPGSLIRCGHTAL